MKHFYLDYAAATPMLEAVQKAIQPYHSDFFHNPSAIYLKGQLVKKHLESARSSVAQILGVRPSEIIFTAGGTEANNLMVYGVMQQFSGANVVTTPIEHDSLLMPAKKYETRFLSVTSDGRVELDSLHELVDDKTVLVSIGYVNNEIGTVQSLSKISQRLHAIKQLRIKEGNKLPLYFHTDACQAGNYLSLQTAKLGIDAMTINGGKLYGPKQSGALYVRAGIDLVPQIVGGGQERGKRSGTENVAACAGFAKSLEIAQLSREKNLKAMNELQEYFFKKLNDHFKEVIINGSQKYRISNNVHVTFPGQDNERLMMKLDERGIQCAVGSACSSSNDEPSHVLKAIGLNEEQARSSLRFSMGSDTSKEAIDYVIKQLEDIL